ncbi:hypothetical protein MMC12_003876 [Toensbergia leucococca]|nr:hypothetical protein [Toensbergia leucococca]
MGLGSLEIEHLAYSLSSFPLGGFPGNVTQGVDNLSDFSQSLEISRHLDPPIYPTGGQVFQDSSFGPRVYPIEGQGFQDVSSSPSTLSDPFSSFQDSSSPADSERVQIEVNNWETAHGHERTSNTGIFQTEMQIVPHDNYRHICHLDANGLNHLMVENGQNSMEQLVGSIPKVHPSHARPPGQGTGLVSHSQQPGYMTDCTAVPAPEYEAGRRFPYQSLGTTNSFHASPSPGSSDTRRLKSEPCEQTSLEIQPMETSMGAVVGDRPLPSEQPRKGIQRRKKRKFSLQEKSRIKLVRKVGACKECRKGKRRVTIHFNKFPTLLLT